MGLPTGGVAAYWTDMRDVVCYLVRCGHRENTYVALAP